jgi:hypothetical protein
MTCRHLLTTLAASPQMGSAKFLARLEILNYNIVSSRLIPEGWVSG